MRLLAFGLLFAASTAVAQPIRFAGAGIADTNWPGVYDPNGDYRHNIGGTITFDGSYASDITVPLMHPSWTFDITTDGQSVTIHEMSVSFSNTLYINPLVWLELSVEAKIEDLTVDINPSMSTVWTVQEHVFDDMFVSGVYHGIGLTQSFSGFLPEEFTFPDPKLGYLDFANWPNDLAWEAEAVNGGSIGYLSEEHRSFSSPVSSGWIGVEPFLHIRTIRVWEPVSVLLTPLIDSADFDLDHDTDGLDFLSWQRNAGMAVGAEHGEGDANHDGSVNGYDLGVWEAHYSVAAFAAAVTVPEPGATILAMHYLAALCSVRCSRQPSLKARTN